jgi:hypothetical protein
LFGVFLYSNVIKAEREFSGMLSACLHVIKKKRTKHMEIYFDHIFLDEFKMLKELVDEQLAK